MSDQLFLIPFLGIFCVAGGLGLGHGLRALIHDRSPVGVFFIVWGAGFAGVPCTIGTSTFLAAHSGPLFLVSPILFLSAMVLSLTILPELLADVGGGTVFAIGFGAMFLFIGAVVTMTLLRQGSSAMALAIGGVFMLFGGLVCALGVSALIGGKQTT